MLTVAIVIDGGVWVESFTFGYSFELHQILYRGLDANNRAGRAAIAAQRRQIDGKEMQW